MIDSSFCIGGTLCDSAGLRPGRVTVADGTIVAVEAGDFLATRTDIVLAPDVVLMPGFVDLQINGYGSWDFTVDPAGVTEAARLLPPTGVTALLRRSSPHLLAGTETSMRSPASMPVRRCPLAGISRVLGSRSPGLTMLRCYPCRPRRQSPTMPAPEL